mmetsp:Transcript_28242/g.46833  ORF Transcript_28242/g.46833 Transcript_28242/m.46833 type:complete len:242 (+) Transcript_28242:2748-3473(+)
MSIENVEAETVEIYWPCEMVVPSKACEERLIKVLHRKGEWGRGRDLPKQRLEHIDIACKQNHLTLHQGLSLRRTMLRSFPNGMARVNTSSSMGSASGQQQVAALLENAVHSFLEAQSRKKFFITQSELEAEIQAGKRQRGPTPDVLFLCPVRINGQFVKWLDAKQYYGSATFAHNRKVPNGKISFQAQRYNAHFGGKGAFVFGQGYCADLRKLIPAVLLDATPLDMSAVNNFQDNYTESEK